MVTDGDVVVGIITGGALIVGKKSGDKVDTVCKLTQSERGMMIVPLYFPLSEHKPSVSISELAVQDLGIAGPDLVRDYLKVITGIEIASGGDLQRLKKGDNGKIKLS
jgi:hypothetical protein